MYLPFIHNVNYVKEYVYRLYEYFVTYLPAIYGNFYLLDKNASLVDFSQSLTDVNLPFHKLRFKVFIKQPFFIAETSPSRASSNGDVVSLSSDQISLVTILFSNEVSIAMGDKIALSLDERDLLGRTSKNVFTVIGIEYPHQQKDVVNFIKLNLKRDVDIHDETIIKDEYVSHKYYFIEPYLFYLDGAGFLDYLKLLDFSERVIAEIKSREIGKLISNRKDKKEYVATFDEVIGSILNLSPDINKDGILKTRTLDSFYPVDKQLTLNFSKMNEEEINKIRIYQPDVYLFDSFLKPDPNGSVEYALPEFKEYLKSNQNPAPDLEQKYNLQDLSTLELFQILVLSDLYIRSKRVL